MREDDTWRYIGHVGTGFSHQTLGELHGKLVKLKVAKSPLPGKVKDELVTTWVRPSLVAEVKFAEWTSKGELRQPATSASELISARRTSCANADGRGNSPSPFQERIHALAP